jgi:uncharacterized SAM-dependent methyltransferase
MLYFKHSELVDKYHVSLKTVHNWIDAVKQGKLELVLVERGSRTYIANNPGNIATLSRMADQGKKYRNARFNNVVTPKPEFYDIYSRRQILDIISNLDIHREIPSQYNYMDGGANNWDNWVKRLDKEGAPNYLNNTIELVRSNLSTVDHLVGDRTHVNIIDIGVGNAYPVKDLLAHLLDKGILHRYIAIDISRTMLDIAEQNIKEWFDGKVNFEGHVRDISHERFDDLVVDDMLAKESHQTVNLVLLLGGTPVNFRSIPDVLKIVYGSMEEDDLLVYTGNPDTEKARRYFDFHPKEGSNDLSPIDRFILDLLNIDASLYEVEMGYDERKKMRFVRIRLNAALTIKFKFENSERSVNLEKGETILLLRIWHMTALEIIGKFENAGFVLLHSNMTKDRERLLTISGVDTKSANADLA